LRPFQTFLGLFQTISDQIGTIPNRYRTNLDRFGPLQTLFGQFLALSEQF
jgi:hypothetical protein